MIYNNYCNSILQRHRAFHPSKLESAFAFRLHASLVAVRESLVRDGHTYRTRGNHVEWLYLALQGGNVQLDTLSHAAALVRDLRGDD